MEKGTDAPKELFRLDFFGSVQQGHYPLCFGNKSTTPFMPILGDYENHVIEETYFLHRKELYRVFSFWKERFARHQFQGPGNVVEAEAN